MNAKTFNQKVVSMRKILVFLLFGVLIVLSACNKSSGISDFSPQNIVVSSGVFQCDTYENSDFYELDLSTGDQNYQYVLPNSYDLNYLLENGTYTLQTRAILGDEQYSDYSTPLSITITDSLKTDVLAEEDLSNNQYIELHGRSLYDSPSKTQMFYYTASGFDVEFYGTSLNLIIVSDNATNPAKQAHIGVVIDHEVAPYDGTTYVLSQSEILLTVADELEEGLHTVSFYKINESLDNNIGIKRIKTDGSIVGPSTDESQLKIQYIGASTTTGYGNMATSATAGKTSENSNGLLAFTSLSAYMLNAEWSITSASGWGISRGWNTGGSVSETLNMPNAFDYTAINSSGQILDSLWDQSIYQPDIYVLNLGSNDYNASNYVSMSETQQAAFDTLFVSDMKAFMLKLHEYNPDAIIIVTYGILSNLPVVKNLTLQAIEEAKLTFTEIYSLELKNGTELGYPYGANYHPSVATHIAGAQDLSEFIASITDYTIVHDTINVES